MQAEIASEGWPIEVDILGVNEMGYESGNDGMSTGRVLPLLQDTASENAWADWDIEYRDVIILDGENVRRYTFNLTVNDLSDPANYAALKALLADLAGQP